MKSINVGPVSAIIALVCFYILGVWVYQSAEVYYLEEMERAAVQQNAAVDAMAVAAMKPMP